jgi:hypothetical protein
LFEVVASGKGLALQNLNSIVKKGVLKKTTDAHFSSGASIDVEDVRNYKFIILL